MKIQENTSEIESFFLALADETRLRILNLLQEREVCVRFFEEALGISQPKISRHLAFLRNVGIVEYRREGKWINYKITEPRDESKALVLRQALQWLNSQKIFQEDYRKLTEICSSINSSSTKLSEIIPNTFEKTNVKCALSHELEIFLL